MSSGLCFVCFFFLLMSRRPPRSTRTDTLFPYTTLVRAAVIDWRSFISSNTMSIDERPISTDQRRPQHLSATDAAPGRDRSEEHTSELQSLMRTSYAVFCLKKKNTYKQNYDIIT